jgi:TolB-like protein
MQIWSAEIKELESLYTSIKGRYPELEKDIDHLIKTDDENVALLYSRRCLEIIVTDLCEIELKRPRKTEPLKGIIDKLNREEKVPSNIIVSMQNLNSLSTFGTHPKDFDPEQVKPALSNLAIIIKWYLKYKEGKAEAEEGSSLQGAGSRVQGAGSKVRGAEYTVQDAGDRLQDTGHRLEGEGHKVQGTVDKGLVMERQENRPEQSKETIKISKRRVVFILSGLFLIIAVVVLVLVKLDVIGKTEQVKVDTELEKSIAVLPFENMSDDEEYSWFGDAMTDEVIMQLYKIKQFVVRSRTSVMQYKGTVKTIPVIGQELKVNYLIEGSAQRFADRVRIRVQLINAKTDDHLWGDTFEGDWKDVLSLQSKIAEQIAIKLKTVLTPEEVANIQERSTENLEAYDLYLLGMHYYNNYSHDSDFYKAINYFQQAINIDTTFALAYAGLADTYYLLIYFNLIPPNEVFPKLKVNAIKALELNEKLANAHCAMGDMKLSYEYDLDGAEKEYVRAIEINPNSSGAHISYAFYLLLKERNDEAILHADISLELDPLSKLTKMRKLQVLFRAGFHSEALNLAEESRDSDPTWFNWYWVCADFYNELEMYDKAITMLETQLSLMGNDNISDELSLLGYVYGRSGQSDKAQTQLDRLNNLSSEGIYISNNCFCRVYLGLGNFDKAIEFLEKSCDDHSIDLFRLRSSSIFDPIRNDPRFIGIMKRVGL